MPFLILLLGLGLLVLLGAAGLFVLLRRVLAQVLLAASAAGLSGLLLGEALGEGIGIKIAAALLLFIPWLLGIRRLWRIGRRAKASSKPEAVIVEGKVKAVRIAPAGAERKLSDAWEALIVEADWAQSRVAVARTSCERFLDVAARAPLDFEAIETAQLIRIRVPQIVETGLDQCRTATASERRVLLEDLVASVEAVGADADRKRERLIRIIGTEFEVQREHLRRRTESDRFSSF